MKLKDTFVTQEMDGEQVMVEAVSYTHLTLPTT